jgi:hypothetical protein
MVKKEYTHLIKPLVVREGPKGLYPEPIVGMEGKDLEGFSAHFFVWIRQRTLCVSSRKRIPDPPL